jgi:phage protein
MNIIDPNDPHFASLPISHETGDALAKPIATSIGEASKTLLDGIFHLALDPVRRFNIQREADLERFKQEIQYSVKNVPEEFHDDSKIGLILKAIEDSRYQLNDEEIRNMFTKLITSTIDCRTNSSISPKYSSIIADMTAPEAKLLKDIYFNTGSIVPLASLKIEDKSDYSSRSLGQDYLLFDNYSDDQKMLDLSLLESSNLIRFHRKEQLVHPHFTNIINTFTNTFPNNLNELFPNLPDNEEVVFEHSYYSLTEIGESFCKIVFN